MLWPDYESVLWGCWWYVLIWLFNLSDWPSQGRHFILGDLHDGLTPSSTVILDSLHQEMETYRRSSGKKETKLKCVSLKSGLVIVMNLNLFLEVSSTHPPCLRLRKLSSFLFDVHIFSSTCVIYFYDWHLGKTNFHHLLSVC